MFEMLPGHHTQNFVSEIYRVRESADPGAEDAHFNWATSYQTGRQGEKEKTKVRNFYFFEQALPIYQYVTLQDVLTRFLFSYFFPLFELQT